MTRWEEALDVAREQIAYHRAHGHSPDVPSLGGMTAESRSRIQDPTDLGPTILLGQINGLEPSAAKRMILEARQLGNITDEQAEILIRELGLASA